MQVLTSRLSQFVEKGDPLQSGGEAGELGLPERSGNNAGLVIERSRVRIPAGAAGKCSSPGSAFCADSYFGIRSTPVLPQ